MNNSGHYCNQRAMVVHHLLTLEHFHLVVKTCLANVSYVCSICRGMRTVIFMVLTLFGSWGGGATPLKIEHSSLYPCVSYKQCNVVIRCLFQTVKFMICGSGDWPQSEAIYVSYTRNALNFLLHM